MAMFTRVSGDLFRDLATGQFVSSSRSDVATFIDTQRSYGFMGLIDRDERQNNAMVNYALNQDISLDESRKRLAEFLARKRRWKDEGYIGDEPRLADTP